MSKVTEKLNLIRRWTKDFTASYYDTASLRRDHIDRIVKELDIIEEFLNENPEDVQINRFEVIQVEGDWKGPGYYRIYDHFSRGFVTTPMQNKLASTLVTVYNANPEMIPLTNSIEIGLDLPEYVTEKTAQVYISRFQKLLDSRADTQGCKVVRKNAK